MAGRCRAAVSALSASHLRLRRRLGAAEVACYLTLHRVQTAWFDRVVTDARAITDAYPMASSVERRRAHCMRMLQAQTLALLEADGTRLRPITGQVVRFVIRARHALPVESAANPAHLRWLRTRAFAVAQAVNGLQSPAAAGRC